MSHIKRIEIKNFIGIEEFKIDAGKVNTLKGHTGSGKTSVIEAIEATLTNKRHRLEVIRHNAGEAILFVELDNGLSIDRRLRDGSSDYLKVRKPGEAVPSSQGFLNQLVNGDIFKPLQFITKTPKEQAKVILALLEIAWIKEDIHSWFGEIPVANYDMHILSVLKQIESLYFEARETVNREVKVLEAQVAGEKAKLPKNYNADEWRGKKVSDYYAKVAEGEEINKKITAAKALIDGLEDKIAAIKSAIQADKEVKKSQFERQRHEIREFHQFLSDKIKNGQAEIDRVDTTVKAAFNALDNELAAKIQALKEDYASKKQQARAEIQTSVDTIRADIGKWEQSKAAKEQELANIDTLEDQALVALDEKAIEQVKTEEAKAGGAREILATTEPVDVEPFRTQAEEVERMRSFIHDWDNMNSIIREKLAPKQETAKTLTARIDKARSLPQELLKIAAVPVPGITVDADGNIRVNGTLIDGLSEGEQMQLAFEVAKSQAGELKLICLDGINKINPADRKWIEEQMATDGFQYWISEPTDGEFTIKIEGATN